MNKKICEENIRKLPFSIPAIRKQLGITQKDLADLLGTTVDSVQNWESGRKKPRGTARKLLGMLATNSEATIRLLKKSEGCYFQPKPK